MTNENQMGIDPRNQLPENIEILANKICEMVSAIWITEELLKENQKQLETWKNELSEILDAKGYSVGSKIILKNGRTIKLKDYFTASIPTSNAIENCKDPEQKHKLQERRITAFEWLENSELKDIIKNNIVISLGVGHNDKVKEVQEFLTVKKLNYEIDQNVHHSTLKASLKEQMKNGINVPFEPFNIQTGVQIDIE